MTIETSSTNPPQTLAAQALPAEFERWHWGAFLLSWIWGIGNSTYVALLALVPFFVLPPALLAMGLSVPWFVFLGACLVMPVVLGLNGYRWAWRNGTWDSVAQFRRSQHNWSKWSIVVVLGAVALGGLTFGSVFGALRFSGAYAAGVDRLEKSAEVGTALGRPLAIANFPMGGININGASGNAVLTFPVSGPQGRGTVFLEAKKDLSGWVVQKLLLRLEGGGVIDVLREIRA